jgi:hypothetical protein
MDRGQASVLSNRNLHIRIEISTFEENAPSGRLDSKWVG